MVVGELPESAELLVIGGGPGGYTTAIRAAQLGLDVTLVEKDGLGGLCTNAGCIPSKALIHGASLYHEIKNSRDLGIRANPEIDMKKLQEWNMGVISSLVKGLERLCKMNKVRVIKGKAGFRSSDKADIRTSKGIVHFSFDKAVIATGTDIREMGRIPFDHERVIDSDDALFLKDIPGKLLIIGGGYIAAEMATLYSMLGSEVTIIYRGSRLLRRMEKELGAVLESGLEELGCKIIYNDEVNSVDGRTAHLKSGKKLNFDKLLVAIGRVIDHSDLGLENTKVKTDRQGRILTDQALKTSDNNIYAVGDVIGGKQLAHKAFREAKVAAEAIAGMKSAFDNAVIPSVVFSRPVLASAGLTEAKAREEGYRVRIGKIPLSASGRARTMNKKEGFVKIVADSEGVVLGVHIASPHADSMVSEAALAIEMGALLEDLALTIHPHPTMSEALSEAAEDALGRSIHMYRK